MLIIGTEHDNIKQQISIKIHKNDPRETTAQTSLTTDRWLIRYANRRFRFVCALTLCKCVSCAQRTKYMKKNEKRTKHLKTKLLNRMYGTHNATAATLLL